MKRLVVLAVVVCVLISATAHAGYMCELAEQFRWMSPAQNTACFLEWIWETIY